MILLIDNFDSFTYNLVDYLLQAKIPCKVIRNDIGLEEIERLKFDAIVLSPGPGIPGKSGNMLKVINQYYKEKPILGICLGHQALGEFYGAKLVKAEKPMHGKLSKINIQKDPIFETIPPSFNVVRYHSLILTEIPSTLSVIASTINGEVMMIKHLNYKSYGIQFHPEAHLTEYGLQLIKNWVKLNQIL